MVLYSFDENSFTIVDCNGHADGDKNCVVNKRDIKYSSKTYGGCSCAISRPQIPTTK